LTCFFFFFGLSFFLSFFFVLFDLVYFVCFFFAIVDAWTAELFCLVIFFCDGFIRARREKPGVNDDEVVVRMWEKRREILRFFGIARRLHLDLQMLLCNRVFGLSGTYVPHRHREHGFMMLTKKLERTTNHHNTNNKWPML